LVECYELFIENAQNEQHKFGYEETFKRNVNKFRILYLCDCIFPYSWPKKVTITRQTMYLQRNIEERSCNHCCCLNAMCYIF